MIDESERQNRRRRRALFWLIFTEIVVVVVGLAILFLYNHNKPNPEEEKLLEEPDTIEYETEAPEESTELFTPVEKPEISEQLLTINDWSRPGKKIISLDYIVIHYLANPKTTAQENHDYFESLKDLQDTSMSANYVIGLEGEIIHCVPDDEVAYASNQANSYSLSIENCHMDTTGEFTDATYESLVPLTAYLSDLYGIDRDHIIRHYDVTGKNCPKYFVEHPDAWELFKDNVMKVREDAWAEYNAEKETEVDELSAFMETITEDTDNEQ